MSFEKFYRGVERMIDAQPTGWLGREVERAAAQVEVWKPKTKTNAELADVIASVHLKAERLAMGGNAELLRIEGVSGSYTNINREERDRILALLRADS